MQTRNTLVMAGVLVLISAFVYFYEIRGREEREEAERIEGLLVVFEQEEVTGLSLTTADGTVEATKADGDWSITAPVATAADSVAIEALIESVYATPRQRQVAEAAEDVAQFGLDAPAATLRLDRGEAEPIHVRVGNETPIAGSVYAAIDDSGNVYSTVVALKSELEKTLFDLRDKNVFTFETSAIEQVEIARAGFDATLTRDPNGWSAESPFSGSADAETVDDLVSALSNADANGFVRDSAPDDVALAEFGLDAPAARATLRDGSGAAYGLVIGGESTDPEGVYAMRDGGNAVFVLDADLLDDFPESATALRDRKVLKANRQRIAEITIDQPGTQTLRLTRDGVDWTVTQPQAVRADSAAVSRLLGALVDMRAEDFGGAGDASTGTIRVGLRDPGDDNNEIIRTLAVSVGRRSSITIGDADEATEVVALTPEGSDTSFLVPAEDVDAALVELFDVRSKTLVEFTPENLETLTVTAAGTEYVLTKNGETWSASVGDLGDMDVGDVLWDLNYLRMEAVAEEWSGEAPNLAPYGLDAPRFVAVASNGELEVAHVTIGADVATEDGAARVYAMIPGHDAVYEIDAALADVLAALVETLGS